ncbi:MAG: hypothetical protein HYX86_00505 [Chloroflexi bacterium]|nr:hypothetical protein [Chloroflexota bacterium]
MAQYLVRARPQWEKLSELRSRLGSGEISKMRPFGRALDYSLRNARQEGQDIAVWEEEDYCRPPLAQERAAVLDHYFANLSVFPVQPGDGWKQIEDLPRLWGKEDEHGQPK